MPDSHYQAAEDLLAAAERLEEKLVADMSTGTSVQAVNLLSAAIDRTLQRAAVHAALALNHQETP